jgi:hypothetical protein
MQSKIVKLALGALLGVSVVLPFTAQARTVGANAAFRQTCFNESYGGVVNGCGSTQKVSFSAPIDSTGTYFSPVVSAQGASAAQNVTCWAQGESQNGVTFYLSSTESLPYYGPAANISLGSVYVPASGRLTIYCNTDAGSWLQEYSY